MADMTFWIDVLLPALWGGLAGALKLGTFTSPFGFLFCLLASIAEAASSMHLLYFEAFAAAAIPDMTFWVNVLLPALWKGLAVTLKLIAFTAPFGFLLGLLIAVTRVYGARPIRILAKLYVIFFRGCPLLLLLFILYFGLPSIGIILGSFYSALYGFILCNSAYNSEYFRGALQSIKGGQMTAAKALGMTKAQAVLYVVIPQALRKALPGVSNEFIYLIKYSSLAYVVALIELTGAAKIVASRYFLYFETFAAVGVFYLVLVTITTIAINALEKKYAIPGAQ